IRIRDLSSFVHHLLHQCLADAEGGVALHLKLGVRWMNDLAGVGGKGNIRHPDPPGVDVDLDLSGTRRLRELVSSDALSSFGIETALRGVGSMTEDVAAPRLRHQLGEAQSASWR